MRYALFYTPPADHPVTKRAASWLGRDAYSGEQRERPSVPDFSLPEIEALTAAPSRYGFHATLKAPFHLAEGQTVDELSSALAAFAGKALAFDLPVQVGQLGPFFALVPNDALPILRALAAKVVSDFEPFRAPLSEAEIARRNPDKLSEQERDYLMRWGYPYVLDSFRFHMTLTGPVHESEQQKVSRTLLALFDEITSAPLAIDGIALYCEPEPGAPFTILERWPFTGNGKTA